MQVGSVGVTDGDDELPGEDVHLTELDGLGFGDVARRSQHQEQRVAVAFELGALVCLYGVLDGELVQLELARDVGELVLVGVDTGRSMRCRRRCGTRS